MRIVVAGGSGLIGRALVTALLPDGAAVTVLTRDPAAASRRLPSGARAVAWDGRDPRGAWAAELAGADAVINLAGATIGHWPWTAARRRLIVSSRLDATSALVGAITALPPADRPAALLTAIGTDGYEGLDREPATEATPFSDTFLARLCTAWEAAAAPAESLGVRVVCLRQGVVIARDAPALRLLALPVRLFVGGPIGGGRQWFSWVDLVDLIGLYRMALAEPSLHGALNATAPEPVHQADLARALGRVLHRPTFIPTPGLPVRLLLGGMATLVLGSRRVIPARATAAGYAFQRPDLDDALRSALA
ncbi:MAG TPA: TIGR01777 family oxidoreductase [Candidatus Limnocylindrales bacterium]